MTALLQRAAAVLACVFGLSAGVDRVSPQRTVQLDAPGRALLDPLRLQAIDPELLLERLAVRPTDTIADIGAGPGYLTLPMARAAFRGRVIATDVRADYLQALAIRARIAELDNVATLVVSADHPELPAEQVDLAVLCQVDHYLSDRSRYLRELVGVLRPAGRIAIVNHARHQELAHAAAEAASLLLIDQWEPSPGFFVHVYQPRR